VRLLRVERQDLISDFRFRDQQGDDGFRAEATHRLQPVIAVGSPVAVTVANDDERIEEAIERFDHRHQPLDVRIRRVALKRGRLDPVDRQRDDEDGFAAERIAIGAKHGTPVAFDRRRQRIGRAGILACLRRRQADRGRRLFLSADCLFLLGHARRRIRQFGESSRRVRI
jgi:hypothetical protein